MAPLTQDILPTVMEVVSVGPPDGTFRSYTDGDYLYDVGGGVGEKPEDGLGFGLSEGLECEHGQEQAEAERPAIAQEQPAFGPIEDEQRRYAADYVWQWRARDGEDSHRDEAETEREAIGTVDEVEGLGDPPEEHQEQASEEEGHARQVEPEKEDASGIHRELVGRESRQEDSDGQSAKGLPPRSKVEPIIQDADERHAPQGQPGKWGKNPIKPAKGPCQRETGEKRKATNTGNGASVLFASTRMIQKTQGPQPSDGHESDHQGNDKSAEGSYPSVPDPRKEALGMITRHLGKCRRPAGEAFKQMWVELSA